MQTFPYSSYQKLLWQEFDLPQSTNSKNPGQIKIIFTSSRFTEYVQNQESYQIQQGIYKFLLSFSFSRNFKLKTEFIIDCKSLLMTKLNKFGVTGLLQFYKRILQCHVAEFPFQKLCMFRTRLLIEGSFPLK